MPIAFARSETQGLLPIMKRLAHKQPGVRELFIRAEQQYRSGKYSQAAASFANIIRRYPKHEPSLVFYGRTLFQLERYEEAHGIFRRTNLATLDIETSYEYAWSFYTVKSYGYALNAFKRVPEGHALYDLANYYGGICALKLRRFEEAEDMFDRALVLPEKLQASKGLYIKHVQEMRLIQQKTRLEQDKARALREMRQRENRPAPVIRSQKPYPIVSKGSELEMNEGYRTVTNQFLVQASNKSQILDFSGNWLDNSSLDWVNVKVALGRKWTLRALKGHPELGLGAATGGEFTTTNGEERRIVAEDEQVGLDRLLVVATGESHGRQGFIELAPWIEASMGNLGWLSLGAMLRATFPDFKQGKQTMQVGADLAFKTRVATVDGLVKIAYQDFTSEGRKPHHNEIDLIGNLQRQFRGDLNLELQFDLKSFQYTAKGIDGQDLNLGVFGQVSQGFPWGVKIGAKAIFELIQGYLYNTESGAQAQADGTHLGGKIFLTVQPWSFLKLELYHLRTNTDWQVQQKLLEQEFLKNVPSFISQTAVEAGFYISF